MLEEYDWTSFSVVTTRHHGYEDFLAMVEGMTDGSFIGWEKKSVVVLNVTDDPGGARTKRLLKDNEAQVRRGSADASLLLFPAVHRCQRINLISRVSGLKIIIFLKSYDIQYDLEKSVFPQHLSLILTSSLPWNDFSCSLKLS